MDRKKWMARAMALTLAAPTVYACNKADKTDETIEVKTEAPPAIPVSIAVNPQGGSTISGELTATHETDKTLLHLNLSGLTEDKDYEAKVRYGDCTMAMQHLADADEPGEIDETPAAGAAPADTAREHEVGDVIVEIDLEKAGTNAMGDADAGNDALAADEPAFLVVTEDMGLGKSDMLVGCADLRGHAGMAGSMGTPDATPTSGAMPADTARKY